MSIKEKLGRLLKSEYPQHRVAVSFLSNLAKAGFGFITSIIIARELGPAQYGEYGFLITSFSTIAYLIDIGGANAFYSHISQRARGKAVYLIYALWMGAQFVLASLILLVLSPPDLLKTLLFSNDRLTLYMAFCAVFGQQQCINALTMILESDRKTLKSQTILLVSSMYYLAVVGIYSLLASLNLKAAFAIMVSQQLFAGVLLYKSTWPIVARSADVSDKWTQCWSEYANYCRPLIPSAIFAFVYTYSDRWLLHRFSGSIEQGYFQIATQLSLITVIITTSLLRVFAKESASALGSGDRERLGKIYQTAYVSSILIVSFISGMIIPWSHEILQFAIGNQYAGAANIMILLLVYPIYQSLGQIAGTFLMSIGQTALLSLISITTITVSLPLGFLMLAPASLHGFNLGGFGLALKMCLISFLSVNILNYVVAKSNGFKHDFMSQAFIPVFLGGGFLSKFLVDRLVEADVHSPALVVLNAVLMILLYLLFALLIFSYLRKGEKAPPLLRAVFHK